MAALWGAALRRGSLLTCRAPGRTTGQVRDSCAAVAACRSAEPALLPWRRWPAPVTLVYISSMLRCPEQSKAVSSAWL